MSKTKTLRSGLSAADLKKGCWISESTRYRSEYEAEWTDEIVDLVLQKIADDASNGKRVHSKYVSNTCVGIADMLRAVKDTINDRLRKGELSPTVLDKLANA